MSGALGRALYGVQRHAVSRNALALTAINISKYVIPLLVVPYLTRKLGVKGFGIVAVTLAAIQFAYVITDYGFSLSATRDVALHASDRPYICKKITSVWLAKTPLIAIALTAMLLLPRVLPGLAGYQACFDAAWIAVLAMALQPLWLFLGIEKMKNVTWYQVATMLLYALLVVLLVQTPDDAVLAIYAWGAAQSVGLVLAVYLAFRLGYTPVRVSLRDCVQELRSSTEYFWSRAAVAIYTSANTIILGSVSPVQAAHYSVCELVYKGGQSVTQPINTALFPYMTKSRDWRLFFRVLLGVGLMLGIGCVGVALLARPLLGFMFGPQYVVAAPVLIVFCGLVFVSYFGVTCGYPAFSALGKVRIANISVMVGTCVQVAIVATLYVFNSVDALTMVLSVVATEICVLVIRASFLFSILRKSSSAIDDDIRREQK